MEEHFFTCPHCWETISVLVDVSQTGRLSYVEDCEVCCNPLAIVAHIKDFQIEDFQADIAQ